MKNRNTMRIIFAGIILGFVLMAVMVLPNSGYSALRPGVARLIPENEEATLKGVIITRDGETFVLRDILRNDTVVVLNTDTKIRTTRKGIFRGHDPLEAVVLQPGLILEAQGLGDRTGRLIATKIEFTEDNLRAAITSAVRATPTEDKAAETEKNLSMTDKKLAQTSQEVADTNKRISDLDKFDVVKTVSVLFAVGKATLNDEAKAQLDALAAKAPEAKNYKVEIQGFADVTGSSAKNLELSQKRSRAVVEYLTVKHNVPLYRITIPMGYGETKATGKKAADRDQDRRVDVRVLVNKGLNQ